MRKSKDQIKKTLISEKKKQALIKGCQESVLTVVEYARANQVSPASLYRWAETKGVSLRSRKGAKGKTGKGALDQTAHSLASLPTNLNNPKDQDNEPAVKPVSKTRPKSRSPLGMRYAFKEFPSFIKSIFNGIKALVNSKKT